MKQLKRAACHASIAVSLLACGAAKLVASPVPAPASTPLRLEKGDRVVFIGNTFAERMSLFAHFETLVTAAHPGHELSFRNLGWSADTLSIQPRPLNFGDMDTHLKKQRADVVIACFGMSESFNGPDGLPKFEQDWKDFIQHMSESKFNGESAPRVAMVSPIAHEGMGDKLPDPAPHNANLKLYTELMRDIASRHKLPFADLFTSTMGLKGQGPKLTRNGIHVNQYGDWVVAQVLARELGLISTPKPVMIEASGGGPVRFQLGEQVPLPTPPVPDESLPLDLRPVVIAKGLGSGRHVLKVGDKEVVAGDAAEWAKGIPIRSGPAVDDAERLRQTIIMKDQQFFYRWRAVNGEYIYGRRAEPFGVINFPEEMKALDAVVADLDGKIWSLTEALRGHTYELVKAD